MKLRPHQKKILNEILEQIAIGSFKGRILLSPRFGKTILAFQLIKKLNVKKVLWVTPSAELAEIGISFEADKLGYNSIMPYIVTSTYASLNKVKGIFDLIILDEEQNITENNLATLLNGQLKSLYLFSMTGTPTKDIDKNILLNRLGVSVILCNMTVKEAVDEQILKSYNLNIVNCVLSEDPYKSKKGFITNDVNTLAYWNKQINECPISNYNPTAMRRRNFLLLKRRAFISTSRSKLKVLNNLLNEVVLSQQKRTLVFLPTIELADKFTYKYHSKTDKTDLDKFNNKECSLLALVNSGGTGFTFTDVDAIIIVQIDSNKNGSTTQKLCRALTKTKKDTKKAELYILKLLNSQDEKWVEQAQKIFEQ